VNDYLAAHPKSGPILDRLHMFDVFASPWFGAVYLLLFISLVGCIVPRTIEHARGLRQPPSEAPRNLERLSGYTTAEVNAFELEQAASAWRKDGWRVRVDADSLSAEKGFVRETGNLFFHVSLLALLVAVGLGSAFGFKGTVIVREGSGFANNVTQYDSFAPGRLFKSGDLAPFSFTLDDFFAAYQIGGMQSGAPREFWADLIVKSSPDAPAVKRRVKVNEPLRVAGDSAYLVGHGYSPEFTLTDANGDVVWQDAAVFLPQDRNFTSNGVVKAPDTVPQIGISGFFLPTVVKDLSRGPRSTFPAATDPAVYLSAWTGDLGLDSGKPQSVYKLDTTRMKRIGIEELTPGETWTLPEDRGTLEFTGYREWASFSITHDSGKGWALGAGIGAIVGLSLSLLVPRRRIWLRATSDNGLTLVEVAGLSRTEAPGLIDEVERMAGLATHHTTEDAHGD
jgi:cytochrome c biogenesis protein